MNGNKKISPVGIGVPSRGTGNYYNKSIPEFSKKIKCVLQKPREISEVVCIDNDILTIANIVDGTPATIALDVSGLLMVYNHYGYSAKNGMSLEHNLSMDDLSISGTVLIVGADKYNPNLSAEQIQSARTWLLKHTI